MKKLKAFFALILAACAAFALVGCGEIKEPDANLVSYDAVVSAPYVETEHTHEWLLYEEALSVGYEGDFLAFLQEIGVSVSDDSAGVNLALASVVCVESTFGSGYKAPDSLGSGVIYSLDKGTGNAYVITNYHVIYSKDQSGKYGIASKISLYLYGGYVSTRTISATFCGGDMDKDVAVLRVTGSNVLRDSSARAAQIGNSEILQRGERIYALGNANGEGFSVTGGVVSVPLETITDNLRADNETITLPEIRIDAKINHGNSGGGLFNAKGELVGIVNARNESEVSVGYAIPTAAVMPVVARIAGSGQGGAL